MGCTQRYNRMCGGGSIMTYKERYYRDHANDKKPLSTRIYEWVVVGTFAVSFIMMLSCLIFIKYWYPMNPTLWIVTYVVSVIVCVFTFDLRVRDDDELRKELGIDK